MNNLLSYCGLVDARISDSDKDLPVSLTHSDSKLSKFLFTSMRTSKLKTVVTARDKINWHLPASASERLSLAGLPRLDSFGWRFFYVNATFNLTYGSQNLWCLLPRARLIRLSAFRSNHWQRLTQLTSTKQTTKKTSKSPIFLGFACNQCKGCSVPGLCRIKILSLCLWSDLIVKNMNWLSNGEIIYRKIIGKKLAL